MRGPNLFLEYLGRPTPPPRSCATAGSTPATSPRARRRLRRIVGRRSTDLIKSGGYKIGAGEIEGALLEHPGVAENAVTGEPDDDLGERIIAWVVPDGRAPRTSRSSSTTWPVSSRRTSARGRSASSTSSRAMRWGRW